ncbi:hypothetical protein LTR36_003584 [Oleoguttula mirabilis]|uniref:PrpF protein n=1 Tax=Oleoguttula mirabilis TaxID=1507867 RepID=A0AAV9JHZ4_9PEZI|nr:hypothetical protein LTR36_003584 [Oleoguttula mirabilis]
MARMSTQSFPATFMRGGTSNGLMIHRSDLPKDESEWQPILSSAMGSPDPYGRQLNGMGSGISSTSKVCVVSRSERQDADVDYTFVQVGIKDGSLDMAGNCGSMSSAVGPFALNEGLVPDIELLDGSAEATVRIFNTNTSKILHSTFSVDAAEAVYEPCGDYSVDGVPGTGSRITLSFLDPGGAKTGKALPTNNPVDTLSLPDGTTVKASLTDIANPGVFILASDVGVSGNIHPDTLGSNTDLMARLELIRREGAKAMGLDPDTQSIPKVVLLSSPSDAEAADGVNIICRALSMQQAHKAVPLTLALNLGASCGLAGTLAHQTAVAAKGRASVVIAHASGRVEVGSVMKDGNIDSALLHGTARVLMKGHVFYTVSSH